MQTFSPQQICSPCTPLWFVAASVRESCVRLREHMVVKTWCLRVCTCLLCLLYVCVNTRDARLCNCVQGLFVCFERADSPTMWPNS